MCARVIVSMRTRCLRALVCARVCARVSVCVHVAVYASDRVALCACVGVYGYECVCARAPVCVCVCALSPGGHPSSQFFPLMPSGQMQLPVSGSHVPPF